MASLKIDGARARLDLMLVYSEKYTQKEVPDPYYGDGGFEQVFELISDASAGLLRHIKQEFSL